MDSSMPLLSRFLIPLVCAFAVPLVACSEPENAEPGSLRMGVAGQDADGNYYRLRSGFIDAMGPVFVTFDTEMEPTTTEYLTMDVPTGDYTSVLQSAVV